MKPYECPFCGNEDHIVFEEDKYKGGINDLGKKIGFLYVVVCKECCAWGPHYADSKKEAIEKWNNRVRQKINQPKESK